MSDQRDAPTWVTLELSPQGEQRVEEGTLEPILRRDLGVGPDHPIFIPTVVYRKADKNITLHLMEGYVFIASGLPDTSYYNLEKQPYASKVMSTFGGKYRMRVLAVVSDTHIQDMRSRLREMVSSEITLHSTVRVLDGVYKNLSGKVTGLDPDNAYVHIKLRSLEVLATVPRIFLEECQDD